MEEGSRGAQTSFKELLATELRLDPRQWEQAPTRWAEEKTRASSAAAATPPSEALLEVDCLVSEPLREEDAHLWGYTKFSVQPVYKRVHALCVFG